MANFPGGGSALGSWAGGGGLTLKREAIWVGRRGWGRVGLGSTPRRRVDLCEEEEEKATRLGRWSRPPDSPH